jgi:hypothetical protein
MANYKIGKLTWVRSEKRFYVWNGFYFEPLDDNGNNMSRAIPENKFTFMNQIEERQNNLEDKLIKITLIKAATSIIITIILATCTYFIATYALDKMTELPRDVEIPTKQLP